MFGTVFQVLAWICAATWFVWPFVFVGTLTGLIRRAVQRPENTAQEQRETRCSAGDLPPDFPAHGVHHRRGHRITAV